MRPPTRKPALPNVPELRTGTLLWMMLAAEGVALVLTLALGVRSAFRFFGAVSLAAQATLMLALLAVHLARPALARMRPMPAACTVAAIVVGAASVVALATAYVFEPAAELTDPDWMSLVGRLLGIVVVLGALGAAAVGNYWRSRQLLVRAKQAELEALQARIQPHFLFNTLNTATALVHQSPEAAERVLLDLADLFRAALGGPRIVPLAEELDLVRRYLDIEQQRFGARLRVEWRIPDDYPNIRVPVLSIQPLVENAIRHGVERIAQGARVEIALSQTATDVLVRVSNPLVLGEGKAPPSHGVGLSAARARIEAMTGGAGTVDAAAQGEYFVATARLPRRPARGARRVR